MLLEFIDVSFSYRASSKRRRKRADRDASEPVWGAKPYQEWALRDISFSLEEGEVFGIAGHTGSGKSTLIQHMNGLLQPTLGKVLFRGEDLADKGCARKARHHIGLVFQSPENQLFAETVFEDVAFGPRNMGLSDEETARRVEHALVGVGLDASALKDRSPFDLSGGQQRRVALAGVLAMQPEVLVLDEPVAGLDPHSRTEFLNLIRSLKRRDITVCIVSHSMEDLAQLCDRVLLLSQGSVFALGTPAEVFHGSERLASIGLGLPAPQAFAEEMRAAGFPLARDLYTEETLADDIAACLKGAGDVR